MTANKDYYIYFKRVKAEAGTKIKTLDFGIRIIDNKT